MLSTVIILLDQLIKYYIVANKPIKLLIPPILNIMYVENRGTIYGFAQGSNTVLIIGAILIIGFLVLCMQKTSKKYSFKRFAFQLILGGGIGNLIDRIARGFVVDYIQLKFFGVFNFADFCIVSGVIILLFEELREIINGRGKNED